MVWITYGFTPYCLDKSFQFDQIVIHVLWHHECFLTLTQTSSARSSSKHTPNTLLSPINYLCPTLLLCQLLNFHISLLKFNPNSVRVHACRACLDTYHIKQLGVHCVDMPSCFTPLTRMNMPIKHSTDEQNVNPASCAARDVISISKRAWTGIWQTTGSSLFFENSQKTSEVSKQR